MTSFPLVSLRVNVMVRFPAVPVLPPPEAAFDLGYPDESNMMYGVDSAALPFPVTLI